MRWRHQLRGAHKTVPVANSETAWCVLLLANHANRSLASGWALLRRPPPSTWGTGCPTTASSECATPTVRGAVSPRRPRLSPVWHQRAARSSPGLAARPAVPPRVTAAGVEALASVKDTNAWHARERAWLTAELARAEREGKVCLVLTHHAPSFHRTCAPEHEGSDISSGFCSALEGPSSPNCASWS